MTTLIKPVLLGIALSFFDFSASAQLENEHIATEVVDYSHVEGTFHFESPTGNMFFWQQSFIQELYADIEHLRQDNEHYRWQFSNDMIIVIYSRIYVESSEFIPNNSPYNKAEKL